VFVFTFTFTLAVLVRVADSVPPLTARLAAYSCLASLGFLYLIDHVGKNFVQLSITEIRHFGASIQVARRLRAMLENIIQTLPEERAVLLHKELELLHRSAERFFTEPEDRALAEVSDFQGVGGKQGRSQGDRSDKKAIPP
jgi:hypothetical protein